MVILKKMQDVVLAEIIGEVRNTQLCVSSDEAMAGGLGCEPVKIDLRFKGAGLKNRFDAIATENGPSFRAAFSGALNKAPKGGYSLDVIGLRAAF